MEKIDIQGLNKRIAIKVIKNVDLTDIDLKNINFSSCVLTNVDFSIDKGHLKLITGINFNKAKLVNVKFDNSILLNVDYSNALLENCSFQVSDTILEPTITKVSFAESKMNKCIFRNTIISWTDFRYTEITNTTFENAKINFCDFYRAHFHKINIFKKAQISNSSLNYTLFEGTIIRKENIKSGTILQENRDNYKQFLVEWEENGPGIRETNAEKQWKPENLEKELNEMHEHAENIYKNLNGNWVSNGFLSDANWAYVKAKRIERKRLKNNLNETDSLKQKIKIKIDILRNHFCDITFGYGESVHKIIRTYIVLIIFFGLIIHFSELDNSIFDSLKKSLLNMVAQTDGAIQDVPLPIIILNIVQSSIGILLTGVFGFIIANRIRHQ